MSETGALLEQTPQRPTVPPSPTPCDPHTPEQPLPRSKNAAASRVRRLTLVSDESERHTTQQHHDGESKAAVVKEEEDMMININSISLLSRPHTPLAVRQTDSAAALHATSTTTPKFSLAVITPTMAITSSEGRSSSVSEGGETGNVSETTSTERGRGISLSTVHDVGMSRSPERNGTAATTGVTVDVRLDERDGPAPRRGSTRNTPLLTVKELGRMAVQRSSPSLSPTIVTSALGVHSQGVLRAMSRSWLAACERERLHSLALHRRQLVTMWSSLVVVEEAQTTNEGKTDEKNVMWHVSHTVPPPLPRSEAASPRASLALLSTLHISSPQQPSSTSSLKSQPGVWARLFALLDGVESSELNDLIGIYMEAQWQAYRKASLHMAFDAMYLVMVAIPMMVTLERNARRIVCMQRDLFMRDRIELFLFTAPGAKSSRVRRPRRARQSTFMEGVLQFLHRDKNSKATNEHATTRPSRMSYAARSRHYRRRPCDSTRAAATRRATAATASSPVLTLPRITAATAAAAAPRPTACLRAREVIEPRLRPRTPPRCPSEDQFFSFADITPSQGA